MNMDHEEVVREPFEGEEDNELEEVDNTRDDEDECEGMQSNCHVVQTTTKHSDSDTRDDDSSSASTASTTFAEDAKFAQSFGIKLKKSKKRRAGSSVSESLFNSAHIKSTTSTSGDSKTISVTDEPMIRTSVTSDCIYHKGTFYQKGDIVALCDQDDGQVYFAQLTGFLQDQYCEKSASLNWLVPIRRTAREFFDPSAYRIGLEDSQLRKLDCMTFVRHCPHDYYLRKIYQLDYDKASVKNSTAREQAYIWTTMEPCRVPDIKTKS